MENKAQPTSNTSASSGFGVQMDAIDLVPLVASSNHVLADRKSATSPSRVSNTMEH